MKNNMQWININMMGGLWNVGWFNLSIKDYYQLKVSIMK